MEESSTQKDPILGRQFIDYCGGLHDAIEFGLDLDQALWELVLPVRPTVEQMAHQKRRYRRIDLQVLWERCRIGQREDLQDAVLSSLKANGYYRADLGLFELSVFRPLSLLRALLGRERQDHEIRYFMMRSLRRRHECHMSRRFVELLAVLARAVRSLAEKKEQDGARRGRVSSAMTINCSYHRDLLPALRAAISQRPELGFSRKHGISMFVNLCRAVGYLEVAYRPGSVRIRASSVDGEFINSKVFGLPTAIKGLDELFGGGGIILADSSSSSGRDWEGARTGLIVGRCGTGKSCFAQQLAVEVAAKGGISWVMPLEQTQEECLYTMASMGLFQQPEERFSIVTDSGQLLKTLRNKPATKGVLVILETVKREYSEFLATFRDNAKMMPSSCLRLLVADPVNAVCRPEQDGRGKTFLRGETVEMFRQVKQMGVNLLLVAEESEDVREELFLQDNVADVENIADIVIRLSVEEVYGYSQRYFEIRKSRLQREQRGRHPFRIRSGEGIEIYPGSAAVAARVVGRAFRPADIDVSIGLTSLDAVLGPGAIKRGDVIAFHGPSGSMKTQIGLFFLACRDEADPYSEEEEVIDHPTKDRTRALLVLGRGTEASVRRVLEQPYIRPHLSPPQGRNGGDIDVCTLPSGHIKPGEAFQAIEAAFLRARTDGYSIDRVMVDNISHWEFSCPFIGNDPTFGNTLIDFLRRERVTTLVVCGESRVESNSVLQTSVIHAADSVIAFDRFEYRGLDRVTVKAQKTRAMCHRREAFEIFFDGNSLEVKPSSSLLRVLRSGEVRTVKVRLFLHSESDVQKDYNESLRAAIEAVLSRDTRIESQDRVYMSKAMALGTYSAVDELQILQLDEFQLDERLRRDAEGGVPLHEFADHAWDDRNWGDFLPGLSRMVRLKRGGFVGLPFYGNASLLAYRTDTVSEYTASSWRRLARACATWESHHPDPSELFFDFPRATPENYNTLFFEIFLGLRPSTKKLRRQGLRTWLLSPLAIEAAIVLRQLCRRAYLSGGGDDLARPTRIASTVAHGGHSQAETGSSSDQDASPDTESCPETIRVRPDAKVWRHWYSTLNQMLATVDSNVSSLIRVASLPRGISTAGEWFLALPGYSAAPDVGLQMINLMASRDAELNRLRLGVGLPTRASFYRNLRERKIANTPISPYFSMPVKVVEDLVTGAFRRSSFGCYLRVHRILASHIQRVLELDAQDEGTLRLEIGELLADARARMDFVHRSSDCRVCRVHHKCKEPFL